MVYLCKISKTLNYENIMGKSTIIESQDTFSISKL
jgi:hypothetical protein